MRKIVNISLPEQLYKEVEEAVKQGRYGTKSELFREMLRAWKEGKIHLPQRQFSASTLLKSAKKHAKKGGPKDLSQKHDVYLYNE